MRPSLTKPSRRANAKPDSDVRAALLKQAAVDAGVAWADWWCEGLLRQGRSIAGGWPGTMSEARAWMMARVSADLGPHFSFTFEELDGLTKMAYCQAKTQWLLRAVRDDDI